MLNPRRCKAASALSRLHIYYYCTEQEVTARMCACAYCTRLQYPRVPYSSTVHSRVPCQQKAKKLICQCAMIRDEPVVFPNYLLPYISFELKRSHYYLFCWSKAHQGARKAAVTCKWRENSWTECFQLNPHNTYNRNTVRNLTTLCLRHRNDVCSR